MLRGSDEKIELFLVVKKKREEAFNIYHQNSIKQEFFVLVFLHVIRHSS